MELFYIVNVDKLLWKRFRFTQEAPQSFSSLQISEMILSRLLLDNDFVEYLSSSLTKSQELYNSTIFFLLHLLRVNPGEIKLRFGEYQNSSAEKSMALTISESSSGTDVIQHFANSSMLNAALS